MDFQWHEEKSDACLRERGFDFGYAVQAFLDPGRVVLPDGRFGYGEERYLLYGRIEGRLFVVAYTLRGNRIRIISARKANAREVRRHGHGTV